MHNITMPITMHLDVANAVSKSVPIRRLLVLYNVQVYVKILIRVTC